MTLNSDDLKAAIISLGKEYNLYHFADNPKKDMIRDHLINFKRELAERKGELEYGKN